MRNPLLNAGDGLCRRHETGTECIFRLFYQICQYVVAFAVGDEDRDAFIGDFTGDAGFGQHSSASKARLGGLNVGRQVAVLPDFTDDF